jgi:hypothetical protein
LRYPHVDKVYNVIENGATEPVDALLDTEERAIVKTFNNIEGNLTLVNEYVCYRLCVQLSIPIPVAGIAYIDEQTIDESPQKIITPEKFGPCFYSKRIDKAATLNAFIIDHIINKEDINKIVLFDHLIYNKDRNRGNIIVGTGKTIYMYAIDHSHVFKNECLWDRWCFERGISDKDYNDTDIINSNREMYDLFWQNMSRNREILLSLSDEFKNKICYNLLNEIISELPIEWEVPEEALTALKDYIFYRLEHINNIVEVIIRSD